MATTTKTATAKTTKRGRPANRSGGQAPALTPEQVKALLYVVGQHENSARNLALVSLLLCGCRVSEPLTITRRSVITSKGQVAESFVLGAANTKSKQARRVYLNDTARKHLSAWLAAMDDKSEGAKVFALAPNYATRLVGELMKAAGIVGSSHSLRRTCATTLADAGVGVHVIKELLGHANLQTTAIYVSASTANVAKAINTNLAW
jgi:integrase/recombinase XerD